MPPTSNMRKSSTNTTTLTQPTNALPAPRRTTSGRAVRANTTRPSNYYARPFANFASASATLDAEMADLAAPGFFPALQYFTDAVTALPKEVMRQFTLMKEVEAKVHGPTERLVESVDEVMRCAVPSRKGGLGASVDGGGGGVQGLLSFTASNSVTGSATGSVVNGVVGPNAGAGAGSAQNSVSGSVNGEEGVLVGSDEEMAKRRKFHELRSLAATLLPNLDEKHVVLAGANRVLAQQMSRLDSVLPHIDYEISEEARLGSMTHWAYSDNRQKKQVGTTAANRRDVAATHSLAAAATALHESDIAQARQVGRETTREKQKGRAKEQLDSDFDDKPKKATAKAIKNKAAAQAAAGLGITANGEPVKKRKLDKGLAAPTMERSQSAATKGAKAIKETARSTPTGDGVGKKPAKAKPAPLPAKRKAPTSTQGSPMLASSPLHSSFNPASIEAGPGRPSSARIRQNSAVTNLRHERLLEQDVERPTSAPGKVNGDKANGKRKAGEDIPDSSSAREAKKPSDRDDPFTHEEAEMADTEQAIVSASNSGKAGRGSKTGTPRKESFTDVPAMLRSRSTRSMRGPRGEDESSGESQQVPAGTGAGPKVHRRTISNSHLVKQLAPFNRSPDLGRRRVDDMDEDLESIDARMVSSGEREEVEVEERSPPKRRPSSRRGTGTAGALIAPSSPLREYGEEGEEEDVRMIDAEEPEDIDEVEDVEEEEDVPDLPELEPEAAGSVDIDEDEDSEPGDPDDPNEPKYCYCNRGSYGDMVACDNDSCPREWFHLECTGMTEPPDEVEKWYCDDCKPLFVRGKGRGRGGRKGVV